MRWDTTGIFWDDYIAPRIPKVKIRPTPPEPTWLSPDYLPGLEEARAYQFDLMTDAELAASAGQRFTWDIEIYPNYVLLGWRHVDSGKIIKFEARRGDEMSLPFAKIRWIAENVTSIGFNDNEFDWPILCAILAGFSTDKLMSCVNDLINGRPAEGIPPMRAYQFRRTHKLRELKRDNIDLIELTPGSPGLKICTGRMHGRRMADLPFKVGQDLSDDQITILRYYWVNDLENTALLYEKHKTAIELREILTNDYQTDVRSSSDPQVAEAIIRAEITRITGQKVFQRAVIEPGRAFRFIPAPYVRFETENLRWVLDLVKKQFFVVRPDGGVELPEALSTLKVPIGDGHYQMGIGGLHSNEKRSIHVSDEHYELSDNDVTSYYPALIIQQGMYPPNIGPVFLQVFKGIYDKRIASKGIASKLKKAGDNLSPQYKRAAADAETLKIVLNGTFGKTGERGGFSVVYYPEMMIQTTLSGQLALLMLIERLELAGIPVVSANTDGIVVKCPRHLVERKQAIMDAWQAETDLGLESTPYKAIYSRDVNNYVAIYETPLGGSDAYRYAKAIGAYRKIIDAYPLKWNPTCEIASEAAIAYLATGTPVEETIRACADVRKFIEVRRVTTGAWKAGEYLGKAIRWYYSTKDKDPIINAKSGNRVPRSEGAQPCMLLPDALPDDLDFDYYIQRAYDTLEDLSSVTAADGADAAAA